MAVLKSFSHLLHRNKKVDFIEQFNEKLLVKQEGENLQNLEVYMHFAFSQISNAIKPKYFLLCLSFNSCT
jgi:hypothetical protein